MKSLLWKIYAFRFFDDFILIYPLYAVMFTDFGVSPFQLSALFILWSLSTIAFEIPSGVWADRYSRRNLLVLGQLIRAVGYSLWLFYPTFWGFLAGFILWGIKGALTSGTFQAFLYDELKALGEEGRFTKVLGRSHTISFAAILLASLGASAGILLGIQFVLFASIAAVLISGVIVFMLPEAKRLKSVYQKNYFGIMKDGVSRVFSDFVLLRLLVFLSLAFSIAGGLEEFWPVFADQAGLPKYGIGIFLASMSAIEGLGSFIAYKFEKLSGRFFYALFVINGILLAIAAYIFTVPILVLPILFAFLFSILNTVFDGKLQHAIASETRATISSVKGLFSEIGAIGIYLGIGGVAALYSYQTSFLAFGVVMVFIGVLYLISSLVRRNYSVHF